MSTEYQLVSFKKDKPNKNLSFVRYREKEKKRLLVIWKFASNNEICDQKERTFLLGLL